MNEKCGTPTTCYGMGSLWGRSVRTGNNIGLLLDNKKSGGAWLLYVSHENCIFGVMKHIRISLFAALLAAFGAPALAADCYADYKAKQDNPLRLHYGVAEVSGECTKSSARAQLAQRLSAQNWKLLNVVSVFGPDGLAKRKNSAGSNFLRF